jgi:hypothetical protein
MIELSDPFLVELGGLMREARTSAAAGPHRLPTTLIASASWMRSKPLPVALPKSAPALHGCTGLLLDWRTGWAARNALSASMARCNV